MIGGDGRGGENGGAAGRGGGTGGNGRGRRWGGGRGADVVGAVEEVPSPPMRSGAVAMAPMPPASTRAPTAMPARQRALEMPPPARLGCEERPEADGMRSAGGRLEPPLRRACAVRTLQGNDGKGLTGVHHTTGRSRRVVPVWSPRTPHAAAAPWSHPLDLHLLHRRADGLSALLSWPRTSGATVVGVGGKRRRRDDVD